MDPADTTRDDFHAAGNTRALTGWRDEVRSFLEKTLDDIQRLSADLWCAPRESETPRAVNRATPPAAARLTTPAREPTDDPVDASRTRLENLKRRLSEKLRSQLSDESSHDQRPPEEQQP